MIELNSSFVFFGNGPVAAASLQGLIDSFGKNAIEAVITKHSAAHHKDAAPVEQLAEQQGLKLLFASTKNELNDVAAALKSQSLLGIVIDYGVVMSRATIATFEKGIINSHFSLLPEWRGADPITFSLLSGQNKTGISLMLIDEGLDTGPLLATAEIPLTGSETGPDLTEALVELSNKTIEHILPLYLGGELTAYEQIPFPTTFSRKLVKADGELLWTKTAAELEREVRAYSGWPKSICMLGNITVAVTQAAVSDISLQVGEITISQNKTVLVGCKSGSLELLALQPAGKKNMLVSAFLNGYGHLIS